MVQVFAVILLDVACSSHLQKVVAGVHELAETVERTHHLLHVGDDRFVIIRHHSHEMVGDGRIHAELNLLGVDEHKLQFIRVFLI